MKELKDRAASVRARLLNLARGRGEDFQITLRNYLFERFLYRLSRSELRDRFVLKGAMLFRLWADQPSVIAEKLEAMVSLGIRNSRIKDFFDIDNLERTKRFDRQTLIEAVRRTFERRGTPIPKEIPVGLTPEFWQQPGRDAQVKAFARRARLTVTSETAMQLGMRVADFAVPLLKAAAED